MLHRFTHRFILMNVEGGSPGGGAPAGVATPAATPQAQGAAGAAAPGLDVSALVAQVKDGIFAELRRSGVFKGGQDPKPNDPSPETPAAATPSSVSAQDVDRLVSRARAFERVTAKAQLTDKQAARMEAALRADAPED